MTPARKNQARFLRAGVLQVPPKIEAFFRTPSCNVQRMYRTSDMTTFAQGTDLRCRLLARIAANPDEVWTPCDFADLGSRAAVDKSLQRLAIAGDLRHIVRGLYDRPRTSDLTGRQTVPDYRAVIQAVTRRDQARAVIDGMTAANELGLTTAVPARIEVLVDARLKPIKLGSQEIHFKFAAPSRLYTGPTGPPCTSSRRCTGCRTRCPRTASASASGPFCTACSSTPGTGRRSGKTCESVFPPFQSGYRNSCAYC